MKKACTAFLAAVVSYGLLGLLVYGVMTGTSSMVRIFVAAYWVIMLLGIVVGTLVLISSYAVKDGVTGEHRQGLLNLIGSATRKRNPILRGISWIEMVVIIAFLSYSGWIFTAVCYAIVTLTVKLCFSIARDNVATLNDKEVGRDGTIKC